jgi:hypothetical protein
MTHTVGQKIEIFLRGSESPDKIEKIELNLKKGMAFGKNQLEIAKLIATATIPSLVET